MAPQDNRLDPSVAATWRRMLWLMRGSAEVVEALAPIAAGMTRDEISRLLARAGAPQGKGVEPVEQVLGLLGVVPRSRYEALLREYEELGERVGEAEQNIDRLRGLLHERGGEDAAEQLLDSWSGLVRRTLRAQAGFVRSLTTAEPPAPAPEALSAPPRGVVEEADAVRHRALPAPRRDPSRSEGSTTKRAVAGKSVTKKPAPKKTAAKKPAVNAPRRPSASTDGGAAHRTA